MINYVSHPSSYGGKDQEKFSALPLPIRKQIKGHIISLGGGLAMWERGIKLSETFRDLKDVKVACLAYAEIT